MQEYKDIIESLYTKYQKNEYMSNRLHYHLTTVLTASLETECNNHGKRLERNNQMVSDQETFFHLFLCKNALFYVSSNNTYYLYDGISYTVISEDHLNYLILTSIKQYGGTMLTHCKYKTKNAMLRKVKERPLWKSIPESVTIQTVLACLYPSCFDTKEEAKYFCTIIGDNLLKKYSEEEGLYFLVISNKLKPKKMFIELDAYVSSATGINSVTTNLVTKYHLNYHYEQCRVIQINNDLFNHNYISNHIIDFLCVCAYYSERYQNSENYIISCGNEMFFEKILFMKGKTNQDVFKIFCDECIEENFYDDDDDDDETKQSSYMEWKTIHYIWKLFIQRKNIPNIIYSHKLKELLKEKYDYYSEIDSFKGLTSKWLPNTKRFLDFWVSTVTNDDTSELEIEEIAALFKLYTNNTISLSEEEIIKILKHYFNTEIIDKKYILNLSCNLWDKNNDIAQTLISFKDYCNKKKIKTTLITFETVYTFYIKQKQVGTNKIYISKRYFEKYMDEYLEDYIVIEKCINSNWLK
jgi:hypothetical protein